MNSTTALSITKSGGIHMEGAEYNALTLIERFLSAVRGLVERGNCALFLGSFIR